MKNIKPGDNVYVIERDEEGTAVDYSCYMYLASVAGAVIVSYFINDLETIDEALEYHIEETAENYDTDLCVFPECDCFVSEISAKENI